jgi:hypothetical protein
MLPAAVSGSRAGAMKFFADIPTARGDNRFPVGAEDQFRCESGGPREPFAHRPEEIDIHKIQTGLSSVDSVLFFSCQTCLGLVSRVITRDDFWKYIIPKSLVKSTLPDSIMNTDIGMDSDLW